jgi:DNA-binding transcriptional LysR family regulator
MSPRDIEAFRAVMTSGTTARAAQLLGVTQPAISQAIQRVERSAQLRLFERVRGRMVPTHEAQVLMLSIERYFVGFEAVEHAIRSLGSYAQGRMTIAAYPALGHCFVPRAIAAMEPGRNNIQASLQVMSSREVHRQVFSATVDFGLMAAELAVEGLEHSRFSKLAAVVAMAPNHRLARKKTLVLQDLQSEHFIALNAEDATRRQLEHKLKQLGVKLNIVMETPYSITACELARCGVGLALVHPLVALDFVPRGLVIKRLAPEVFFQDELIFRTGNPLQKHSKTLLSLLRMQLKKECEQLQAHLG